ncbi:hypothetical protein [Streptomyces sp. NPDC088748]|uniref:hypothetical protein n=1 Tax=Streptomyces sp. NPDC088748 TaxID=3365887 RepID=UPI0038242964
MNQGEDLAAALQQAAGSLPVGPPPLDTVVRLGRKMRRRRQATLSTALAAVVLIPASAVSALSFDSLGSGTPTIPASTTASTSVRVVGSGETIALARANTMRLTGQGVVLVTPKSSGTTKERLLKAAEVPSGMISATTFGDASGTLYTGIYRGPRKAASVIVTIDSRSLSTQVVTLAGSPGWAAFYANDTRVVRSGAALTITVRAADGTILATMTKPAQN